LTHDIALIPSDGIVKRLSLRPVGFWSRPGRSGIFDFESTEYKYRREVREYGETVVVSIQSLIDNHPELQDMLSDQGVDEGQMEFVAMIPPDEGPQFVVADAAGRIKVLADELVKVQKREEEIKQEMKELLR
jgi:hypothetical protein